MNKIPLIIIGVLAVCVILISYGYTRVPICNPPYIVHGTDCCLDQNSNNICDSDETTGGEGEEITTFSEAEQKAIKINEDNWNCDKPLSDSLVFSVHMNRDSKTMECQWKNRYEFVDAVEEKSDEVLMGIHNDAEILIGLIDSCNSTTYDEFERAMITSDWMEADTNMFIFSDDAIPSDDVYAVFFACYFINTDGEKDPKSWSMEAIDKKTGKSLIS